MRSIDYVRFIKSTFSRFICCETIARLEKKLLVLSFRRGKGDGLWSQLFFVLFVFFNRILNVVYYLHCTVMTLCHRLFSKSLSTVCRQSVVTIKSTNTMMSSVVSVQRKHSTRETDAKRRRKIMEEKHLKNKWHEKHIRLKAQQWKSFVYLMSHRI